MFVQMLQQADELRAEPEFYNTLTNTCTTNLVRHVNTLVPGRIPLHPSLLLPGTADKLACDLGLIDNRLPFEEVRRRARVNDRARPFADAPEFSTRIRGR